MQIVNFYRQQNAFIITWLLPLYEVKSQGLYSLIQLNLIQIHVPGYIYNLYIYITTGEQTQINRSNKHVSFHLMKLDMILLSQSNVVVIIKMFTYPYK